MGFSMLRNNLLRYGCNKYNTKYVLANNHCENVIGKMALINDFIDQSIIPVNPQATKIPTE